MRRLIATGALVFALAAVPSATAMTLGARMAVWHLASARHGEPVAADFPAALDAGELAFTTGGDAEWIVENDAEAVGDACARSGAVGDAQSSWIDAEVEGPGTVSFRWKVSSQTRLDTFSFWIDGIRRASVAGERGWETMSFDVAGDGIHTLRWMYAKSASGASGEDCGWLDDVQWSPGLAEMTIGTALDAPELDWTTGGDGAGEWVAVTTPSWDGVDACAANAQGVSGVARLATLVAGQGKVSFRWKMAAGAAWSGIAFMIDGEDVEICESESWALCTIAVTGAGAHVLAWEFFWDGTPEGSAGFLDHVAWMPDSTADHTLTTPIPVPHSWFDTRHPSLLAAHGGDYEAAAMATAANGVNKVWECYVAGISPTDPAARFLATISMDAGGTPHISHLPPLSAEEEAKREYRVLGKRTLDPNEDWTDVTDGPDPDAAGYRFFKAAVRMRE